MKKKLTLTLLSLVCAICCAFGFAACGGATKLSVAKFEDEGIAYVSLYAASYDEYEKHKDDNNFNGFNSRGSCFEKYEVPEGAFNGELKVVNKYKPIKLGSGKWYGVVTVSLDTGYDLNDLKLEINGEEKEFLHFEGLGVFGNNPFVEIGEFSGDMQIKLKGSTKLQTYKPAITLKDYEANKDRQDAKDLRFKAEIGAFPLYGGGSVSYDTPIEYNSKTEFTATELKEALESKEFTYSQFVKVTAYFENKTKFFADVRDVQAFFNAGDSFVNLFTDNANKEVTWEFGYNLYGRSITLEYSKLTTTPSIKGKNFEFSAATGDGASEANAMYAGSTISFTENGNTLNVSMYIPGMSIAQSGTFTQNGEIVTMIITKRTYNANVDVPIEGGSESIQCTYDGRNLVATYEGITLTFVDQSPAGPVM